MKVFTFLFFATFPILLFGQFGSRNDLSGSPDWAKSVFAADLDNDGDMDILIAAEFRIEWYENLGNGIFSNAYTIASPADINQARSVHAADLDNDGDIDVLYAGDSEIAWHQNDGSGNFGPQIIITPTASSAQETYAADFDNDGDNDVLYVSISGAEILYNDGAGNFTNFNIGLGDYGIHHADMDNDGDNDIFLAQSQGMMYLRNDNGTFVNAGVTPSNSPISIKDIVTIDIDHDDTLEVVISSNSDEVSWFDCIGGQIINKTIISSYTNYAIHPALCAADIDNDGDDDLLSTYGNIIEWYENLDTGDFGPAQFIGIEEESNSIFASDLDNDGDLDVITSSYFVSFLQEGQIGWYENQLLGSKQVSGRLFVDVNQNGLNDSVDIGFGYTGVFSTPMSDFTYTFPDGNYFMNFSDTVGNYTLYPDSLPNWNIVTDSLSYQIAITQNFTSIDSLDFGYYPSVLIDSIRADITGGLPQCNNAVNYWLNLANLGTTLPSGVIHLQLDDSISYLSSVVLPDSIIGQNIYWNYDSLMYFSNQSIQLEVLMPDFNSMGDTLTSFLNVSVLDLLFNTVYTHSDSLAQVLVCAYDPNDKISEPAGFDSLGYISRSTEYIEYTIRFQNTGNDTAQVVRIFDQLDPNLKWQGLSFISSSHTVQIQVDQTGEVEFLFNNIMLPDSNANFLGSQGYVKYRISPNLGLPNGTTLYNTAEIYFDQNPAVITNIKLLTLYDCMEALDGLIYAHCQNDSLIGSIPDTLTPTVYTWEIPNILTITGNDFSTNIDTIGTFQMVVSASNGFCNADTSVLVIINQVPTANFINLEDTICLEMGTIDLSTIDLNATPTGGTYSGTGVSGGQFDPSVAGTGEYILSYTYALAEGCVVIDSVVLLVENCAGLDESTGHLIQIIPNPNSGIIRIKTDISFYEVTIFNTLQSVVYKASSNINEHNLSNLPSGAYFIQISSDEFLHTYKIVIAK